MFTKNPGHYSGVEINYITETKTPFDELKAERPKPKAFCCCLSFSLSA